MLRNILLLPVLLVGLYSLWTLQDAWMFEEAAWMAAQSAPAPVVQPPAVRPPVVWPPVVWPSSLAPSSLVGQPLPVGMPAVDIAALTPSLVPVAPFPISNEPAGGEWNSNPMAEVVNLPGDFPGLALFPMSPV